VVALREIADEQLSPGDLKEDLIHSLQKHVEVDEPEDVMEAPEAEVQTASEDMTGVPETPPQITFDTLSEEELLAGIQGLVPPEKTDDL